MRSANGCRTSRGDTRTAPSTLKTAYLRQGPLEQLGLQYSRRKLIRGSVVGTSVAAWSGPSRTVGQWALNTGTTTLAAGKPRRSALARRRLLLVEVLLAVRSRPWVSLWRP